MQSLKTNSSRVKPKSFKTETRPETIGGGTGEANGPGPPLFSGGGSGPPLLHFEFCLNRFD